MITTLSNIARRDGIVVFGAWPDPVLVAFDSDSDDTLKFLAPVIGPTATLALHHLARKLRHVDAVCYDLRELSQAIGLGNPDQVTHNRRIIHTLGRLEMFGYLRLVAGTPHVVEVRTKIPPLPRRQARDLPATVRHDAPTL